MGKRIDPVITYGKISANCPRCEMRYQGDFSDVLENSGKVLIELRCTSEACGHVGQYWYQWPDELPKVTLRHVSNGRALGGTRRKKKRKPNPDGVIRGQMSFVLAPDQPYVYEVGHDGSGGSRGSICK